MLHLTDGARLTHDRARVSPTHIAFAAKDRATVRDCYAAALNAGAHPSGAPSYRNNDCSCFNAAIEDFDGNTVEFIFREPSEPVDTKRSIAPSQHSASRTQKEANNNGFNEDMRSFKDLAAKTQSRAQTALDVASSAAKSMKTSSAPTPGITRSRTEPVSSTNQNGSKALMGTLLGAAAGAAFAYAVTQSEKDSARKEAAFASEMRSRGGRPRGSSDKSGSSKASQRSRGTSETARGARSGPHAIEPAPYDDYEVQEVLRQRRSTARPTPQRSRTYDETEYAPNSSHNARGDRFSVRRASTMPVDLDHYYIEGPRSKPESKRDSRRGSVDDSELERYDSGVSMNSRRSRRSSSGDKNSMTRQSRRNSYHESAANVPLPTSRTASYINTSKAPSYVTAAQVPLPQSRGTSYLSAAQAPTSAPRGDYLDAGEESDGLGDLPPVTPDDSISCVDFSKPTKKTKSSGKSSVSSSKRSQADSERTVRPAKQSGSKHSVRTLPTRRRDSFDRRSKRSTATYA